MKLLLSLFTTLFTMCAVAQFNTDTTFGNNGLVRTTIPSYKSIATDLAFEQYGKIVVCGYSYQNIDNELERNNLVISRYNTDGTADLGFGPQNLGYSHLDAGTFETSEENFVRTLPDGKIIVAVVHQQFPGSGRRLMLIRLLENGLVDNFFGQQGGRILLPYNGEAEFYLAGLEMLPDGKFLLACGLYTNDSDFALMRVNADGEPDITFGLQGLKNYNFGNAGNSSSPTTDVPGVMKIQSDGKILLGGYTISGTSNDVNFGLIRINNDGSIDTTFGQNGRVITTFTSGQAIINAISIASDGKIYASGTLLNTTTMSVSNIIVRYLSNGNTDTSFGENGKVTTTTTVPSIMNSSVIQPDGKLLLAGNTSGSNPDFACLRYNNNGSPDTGFGTLGLLTVDFGNKETGTLARFQPDGNLLLAGSYEDTTTKDVALMRFNTDLLSTVEVEEISVKAFPNPFSEGITLEGIENPDTIAIFDSLGRKVDNITISSEINSTYITTPPGLSPGVYLLILKIADKSFYTKIIKK